MEISQSPLPQSPERMVAPASYRRSPLKQLILLTPFNYFVKKCSFEDKLLNPDRQIDFTEFSKLCAERWKKMNDLEKAPYQEVTDRENERLKATAAATVNEQKTPAEVIDLDLDDEEKEETIVIKKKSNSKRKNPPASTAGCNENEVVVKKARVRRAKKPKDPNAPKRYMSSFFHYSNVKRAEVVQANPTLRVGDIAKILGTFWREMGAEEKRHYENLALKDKRRYEALMEAYKMAGQMDKEEGEVTVTTCPGSSESSSQTDESQY